MSHECSRWAVAACGCGRRADGQADQAEEAEEMEVEEARVKVVGVEMEVELTAEEVVAAAAAAVWW